jgi:hypothetical protein
MALLWQVRGASAVEMRVAASHRQDFETASRLSAEGIAVASKDLPAPQDESLRLSLVELKGQYTSRFALAKLVAETNKFTALKALSGRW